MPLASSFVYTLQIQIICSRFRIFRYCQFFAFKIRVIHITRWTRSPRCKLKIVEVVLALLKQALRTIVEKPESCSLPSLFIQNTLDFFLNGAESPFHVLGLTQIRWEANKLRAMTAQWYFSCETENSNMNEQEVTAYDCLSTIVWWLKN